MCIVAVAGPWAYGIVLGGDNHLSLLGLFVMRASIARRRLPTPDLQFRFLRSDTEEWDRPIQEWEARLAGYERTSLRAIGRIAIPGHLVTESVRETSRCF